MTDSGPDSDFEVSRPRRERRAPTRIATEVLRTSRAKGRRILRRKKRPSAKAAGENLTEKRLRLLSRDRGKTFAAKLDKATAQVSIFCFCLLYMHSS